MNKQLISAAALAFLAACGSNAPSGDLTADESQQLNEAAAMLDDNSEAVAVSEDAAANSDAVASEAPAAK